MHHRVTMVCVQIRARSKISYMWLFHINVQTMEVQYRMQRIFVLGSVNAQLVLNVNFRICFFYTFLPLFYFHLNFNIMLQLARTVSRMCQQKFKHITKHQCKMHSFCFFHSSTMFN